MRKELLALSLVCLLPAGAQKINVKVAEEYSPYVFGFNLEHTRSAVNGGLSAQMLKNRKFAGKPAANLGLCSKWFPIGERVLYMKDNDAAYTKHIGITNLYRQNEFGAQVIENIIEGRTAGMGQHELGLAGGKVYELRTVTRVNRPVSLKVELTNRVGDRVYASHVLTLAPAKDWVVSEFTLTPSADDAEADVRYTFTEQAELTIGALSMMPQDNFHGMRRDVVEHLKQLGPRVIRWPGGNFAGEYRWKDGLLPVDQRGPLQAAREIETQPHSDGYDYHEINTDDFIALCREVGAEPLLTINLAWESAEESAQWVEYCNGAPDTEYGRIRAERGHKEPFNVHFWSLGNEMGYGHMEGPNGPDGYSDYALRHAEAMLAVTPDLELFASGPYPNDDWAKKSAARMADKVKYISLHNYYGPTSYSGGGLHYTTPEDVKRTYDATVASALGVVDHAQRMRKSLDATGHKLHISYDEWNQWYAWYRPSCVGEGIFAARMMHYFLNYTNAVDIPVVCYFQPVGEGAIIIDRLGSRLTAIGQVFSLMKVHQDGQICQVTENDDLSTTATLRDGVLSITLINEKYDEERSFNFPLKGKVQESIVYTSDDVLPYSYFSSSPLEVTSDRKGVSTVLPPHSIALLRIKLK
ncbi:MAG: hypothetical protein IJR87_06295 [Bacteroidaceae bacterium]|nr:hypothetical protein [Bacteroidaceae bacterium]